MKFTEATEMMTEDQRRRKACFWAAVEITPYPSDNELDINDVFRVAAWLEDGLIPDPVR